MPTIIRSWPEASEPPGIAVSELENPTTHGLVGDFEAALGQQILDVSEAQREAAIEPYGVLDDLGRESVATIRDQFHRWRLDYRRSTRKPINVTTPTSDDFRDALAKQGIECSMSSSGNCYDNAVVESFFGLLKRERVNRVRYRTRDEARADVFDYIEVFYNRKRRHGYLGNISPVDFEERSTGSFETVH